FRDGYATISRVSYANGKYLVSWVRSSQTPITHPHRYVVSSITLNSATSTITPSGNEVEVFLSNNFLTPRIYNNTIVISNSTFVYVSECFFR
ncbi:MAG: hypothetical protein AABX95_02755, partial [Nanoarchaeota archaeon]